MAAPMREGAPAGGARPAPHAHPANFEYDDNEWDIGIGDLIIDLDADIEKTDEAGGMAARAEPDAQRTALKMKIKRTKPGTKSSEAKHEIVKSNETNGEPKPPTTPAAPPAAATDFTFIVCKHYQTLHAVHNALYPQPIVSRLTTILNLNECFFL